MGSCMLHKLWVRQVAKESPRWAKAEVYKPGALGEREQGESWLATGGAGWAALITTQWHSASWPLLQARHVPSLLCQTWNSGASTARTREEEDSGHLSWDKCILKHSPSNSVSIAPGSPLPEAFPGLGDRRNYSLASPEPDTDVAQTALAPWGTAAVARQPQALGPVASSDCLHWVRGARSLSPYCVPGTSRGVPHWFPPLLSSAQSVLI